MSCKYGLIKGYYANKMVEKAEEVIDSIEKNEDYITELAALLFELQDYEKGLKIAKSRDDYRTPEAYTWRGFNEYMMNLYEES